MNARSKSLLFALAAAFVFGDVEFDVRQGADMKFGIAAPAEARVGHPLTPLSYAGVARRSARRTVRRTAYRLSVLPAGCIYGPYYGAYYYRCGSAYYVRSGGVYVQVIIE